MLAYVFWHWTTGDPHGYEQLQQAFHGALARTAPPGFRGSVVFRVQGTAAWLGGAPAYADWYLVDGSAALDPLNVAAVSGDCREPHDRLASAMAAGAGSLLALRGEQADVAGARRATWLAKQRGMSYDAFYAALGSVPSVAHASLWRRQMVLGPTPEFGLLSAEPVGLPQNFQPLELELSPIWTGR